MKKQTPGRAKTNALTWILREQECRLARWLVALEGDLVPSDLFPAELEVHLRLRAMGMISPKHPARV